MTSNDLAHAEQQTTPAALKPAKEPRIPKKIRHACELLADGHVKTVSAAAERVKLSREHLSRMLGKHHIRAYFTRRAAENIDRAQLRASARLVELIDAQSEHVAAKVSERILENTGVLKAQSGGVSVSVNTTISAGYVVDLTPKQAVTVMDDQRAAEAKTLENMRTVSD